MIRRTVKQLEDSTYFTRPTEYPVWKYIPIILIEVSHSQKQWLLCGHPPIICILTHFRPFQWMRCSLLFFCCGNFQFQTFPCSFFFFLGIFLSNAFSRKLIKKTSFVGDKRDMPTNWNYTFSASPCFQKWVTHYRVEQSNI